MYWFVVMSGEKDGIWEDEIEYQEFDNEDDAWDAHLELIEDGRAQELVLNEGYTEIDVQTFKHGFKDKLIRDTAFFRDGAVNDIAY